MILVDPQLKTLSGKILRGAKHRIADGEEYSVPSTIDDPAILPEIEAARADYRVLQAIARTLTDLPAEFGRMRDVVSLAARCLM